MSIDIFAAWYALGGSQSPPTLSELIAMPAWLLKDVRYIFSEIGSEREIVKRNKPRKPKPHRRAK